MADMTMDDATLESLTAAGEELAGKLDAGRFDPAVHGAEYVAHLERFEAAHPFADPKKKVAHLEGEAAARWRTATAELKTASDTLDAVLPQWQLKLEASKALPDARAAFAASRAGRGASDEAWLLTDVLDELRTARITATLGANKVADTEALYQRAVADGDGAAMRVIENEVMKGLPSMKRRTDSAPKEIEAFSRLRAGVVANQDARVPRELRERVARLEQHQHRLRLWAATIAKVPESGYGGQTLHRHGVAAREKAAAESGQ